MLGPSIGRAFNARWTGNGSKRFPNFQRDARPLWAKFAQAWMALGTRTMRPMETPLRLGDGHVVDAGLAPAHQALGVELPWLTAIRAVQAPSSSCHSYWKRTAIR